MKFNPSSRRAAYGRPRVPAVPVPVPFLAVAALVAAFALGRASRKMYCLGGGPCREAASSGPRRERESSASGEETTRA